MRTATWIFCFSLLLSLTTTAEAGWLRDRLSARAEAHAASSEMESDDGAGSASLPTDTKILKDIAYGNDKRQKLDVYLPAIKIKEAPVIFMVHGGAWRVGDKNASKVVQNKIARWLPRGFIFISVNYRLLPDADPLQQAEDVAQALAYAQAHARDWGGDPGQFLLMGHSAGAHLVSLLSANPALATAQGAQAWRGTVALDSAAMDVTAIMQREHYRFYDKAFGKDADFWRQTSPLAQLQNGNMPLLLVCSTKRPDAPCDQANAFAATARKLGHAVDVLPQPLKHGDINGELGKNNDYTRAVETFMKTLGPSFANRLGSP